MGKQVTIFIDILDYETCFFAGNIHCKKLHERDKVLHRKLELNASYVLRKWG